MFSNTWDWSDIDIVNQHILIFRGPSWL